MLNNFDSPRPGALYKIELCDGTKLKLAIATKTILGEKIQEYVYATEDGKQFITSFYSGGDTGVGCNPLELKAFGDDRDIFKHSFIAFARPRPIRVWLILEGQ